MSSEPNSKAASNGPTVLMRMLIIWRLYACGRWVQLCSSVTILNLMVADGYMSAPGRG